MKNAILLVPAAILLTALATFGGVIVTHRSLILGLRWFNDWLPAALIATSTYAFARRSAEENLASALPQPRIPKMFRLARIAALGILFTMGFRYFLQPLALNKLTPGAVTHQQFTPFAKEEEEAVTDTTPLPYTAPVKEHFPSALEKEMVHTQADDRLTQTSLVPEYFHETGDTNQSTYTRENLLRAARDAYLQDRWFDAHYYATLAQMTAANPPAGENQEMEQIAKDAWTRISLTETFINETARSFFLKKREGYGDLMGGRILAAYGIFSELKALSPNDPDVNRYFDICNEQVKAHYYFTDELAALIGDSTANKAPPGQSPVYFTQARPGGGFFLFFAKSLTTFKTADDTFCFARDFAFSVYGRDGFLDYSFVTPYAKLVPVPAGDVDAEQRRRFALAETGEALLVMLEGVDRSNGRIIFSPNYTLNPLSTATIPTEATRYLNFGLTTLHELSAAEGGPEHMDLPALWRFTFIGGQFGFPVETYFLVLLDNICLPFLFLLIQFFLALAAQRYGFGETRPRFLEALLFIILVTGLAYGAFSLLTLVSHLFGFALLAALPPLPTLLIMVACNLAALGICIARSRLQQQTA